MKLVAAALANSLPTILFVISSTLPFSASDNQVTVVRSSNEPRLDRLIFRFINNLARHDSGLDVASKNFLEKYGLDKNQGGSRVGIEFGVSSEDVKNYMEAAVAFVKVVDTVIGWIKDLVGITTSTTTTPAPELNGRVYDQICDSMCNCDPMGGSAAETCPPLPRRSGKGNEYLCAKPPACRPNCNLILVSYKDPNIGTLTAEPKQVAKPTPPPASSDSSSDIKFDVKKTVGLKLYEREMSRFNSTMRKDFEDVVNKVKPYAGAQHDIEIILEFFNDRTPRRTNPYMKKGKHRLNVYNGPSDFSMAFRAILGHLMYNLKTCPACEEPCFAPKSYMCPNYADCGSFMCHCQDALFGLSADALKE